MEYVELSLKDVKEKSKDLYNTIKQDYFEYELVIFIAKGSYLIGYELAELNKVPLLEIYATRKGGKLKNLIKPILKIIPKNILIKLRKKEMNSNFHERNNSREIIFNSNLFKEYKNCKNILLVDDSIDSGYSVLEAKKVLDKYFNKANIKVAVFNVMNKSIIGSDYNLFTNMMINGPWSNDSKYNSEFIKKYIEWKSTYGRESKCNNTNL